MEHQVGLQHNIFSDDVRKARDAETAHLEAVLKTHGVKAIRLALLADHVRQHVSAADVELKTQPGDEPQLWLDLAHRVTMEPDAKTFRLSHLGVDRIETLLETDDATRVLAAIRSIAAHREVVAARSEPDKLALPTTWSYLTLFYVWLTGIITGAAALALYFITLKKLPF
jgi:hypothetical protein